MYKYPVYKPDLSGSERTYVNDCLDTTWISSKGEYITKFEKGFAEYLGAKHATAVCNGTVALHLALVALGIGAGDEVIVPTFTYIASANTIVQTGAKAVFVDSLAETWQMDPDDIENKISEKTKAIVVVHLYGHPCDMDRIMALAKKYDLFVIEDCAEAIGSEYKGKKVGTFGNVACFSFFGNKTITCGEGGMVVTDSSYLYERLVHFKGQGLAKYREYWHDVIGYNYRMTNIQAAIGLAQLEKVEDFITKKQMIAKWYQEFLKDLPVVFHQAVGDIRHTWWMCSILAETNQERDNLRDFLKEHQIETRPTFYPVHTMPIFSQKYESHPVAENIALRGINLPSYPLLSLDDIKFICDCIKNFWVKR